MKVSLNEWIEDTLQIGYVQDGMLLGNPIVRCTCGGMPTCNSVDTTNTPDANRFGPRRKCSIRCRCGNATTVWASSTDGEAIDGAVAEWNLAYGMEIEPEKRGANNAK